MQTLFKLLCSTILLLSLINALSAQIRVVDLAEPSRMGREKGSLFGGGSNDVGTIYYGTVPANSSSKPVLVFIHGYNSSAKTWWEDNSMYNKAFVDGYRTAFVSVNPDKSYYDNGVMFKNMINTICQKYAVSKVNVIAHSKGGVDSDAATALYGALNQVQRVITLGSPHFGTPLSDLAQSGWVSWLTTPIGQNNAGTQSLQTGAMSNFRNQINNNANGRAVNFRTFGSWGYSGSLWVSGVYLSWNGGGSSTGGNDGVVNYTSTRRPNSAVIFGVNDSRGNLNHSEIHNGDKMWNQVKLQLSTSATSSRGITEEITPENYNPTMIVKTRSQIISADKGSADFYISKFAKNVRIEVYQNNINAPINFVSLNKNNAYGTLDWKVANVNADNILGQKVRILNLDNVSTGTHSLSSSEPFVALVYSQDDVEVSLSSDLDDQKLVYQTGEDMNFKLDLNKENLLNNAIATGMMVRISDLEGNKTQNVTAERMAFSLNNQSFNSQVKGRLPEGIYNISIEVKGEEFTKSIVTSIAIVGKNNNQFAVEKDENNIVMYPNPTTEKVTFRIQIKEKGKNAIRVYDNNGREMYQNDLSHLDKGTHEVTWEINKELRDGLYFSEFNLNGKRTIQKLVIKQP